MDIVPIPEPGRHCQYRIDGYTAEEISELLGFKPNCKDDPGKVKNSWGFEVDGVHCGIWDYKGSHRDKVFSAYGDKSLLEGIFGRGLVKKV